MAKVVQGACSREVDGYDFPKRDLIHFTCYRTEVQFNYLRAINY